MTTSADTIAESQLAQPPLHGYRGEWPEESVATAPRGLTLAISREAGARGTTIARKVGELLGWQVFDQELLDYLLLDETGRARLLSEIPPSARAWSEAHFERLKQDRRISADAESIGIFQLMFAIAARGDAVLVGRGAGFLLPAETTVHARIVAPFESRVNFMCHSLRLTREEAEAEVRNRDSRRSLFLTRTVHREPADETAYDVIVNSTRLGLEGAAQFLGWAVRTKQQFLELSEPAES
jgi:cytidylate kinase